MLVRLLYTYKVVMSFGFCCSFEIIWMFHVKHWQRGLESAQNVSRETKL